MSNRKLVGAFILAIGVLIVAVALAMPGPLIGFGGAAFSISAVMAGAVIIVFAILYILTDPRIQARREQLIREFETVSVSRKCSCGGVFTAGEVIGRGDYAIHLYFRRKGEQRRAVVAFRCVTCGKMEFYA